MSQTRIPSLTGVIKWFLFLTSMEFNLAYSLAYGDSLFNGWGQWGCFAPNIYTVKKNKHQFQMKYTFISVDANDYIFDKLKKRRNNRYCFIVFVILIVVILIMMIGVTNAWFPNPSKLDNKFQLNKSIRLFSVLLKTFNKDKGCISRISVDYLLVWIRVMIIFCWLFFLIHRLHPCSSSFLTELFHPSSLPMRFFCSASSEAYYWPNFGFIYPTLHQTWCFP